jgi:hypothetical protein
MSRSGQEYSAEEQRAATGKGGVVVAMHASASNQAEVRLNLELDLISGLTVDPSKIPIAREIVDPAALSNAEHREILRALYRAYTARRISRCWSMSLTARVVSPLREGRPAWRKSGTAEPPGRWSRTTRGASCGSA